MIMSWGQIRDHYTSFPNAGASLQAIHKLVSEIETSRYKDGLFAWTSVANLCIVQTPVTYPYDGPYLRISPLDAGQLEFRYVDTYFKHKQWHRVVAGDGAFARLESFIKQLHWFGP
jgi:hypothetical protein